MPRETIMALPSDIQLCGIADLLQSPMVGTIGDIVGGVFGVPGVGSIAQGIISPLAKPKPKTVNPMAQMVQQYLAPRYAKPSKLYMQRLRELGLAKGSRFADFTRSMAPVGIGYDPTVLRELRPKKPKKAKKKVPHQFRGHGQPMFYGYG